MISTLRKHRRKQSRVDQKKKAVESECSETEQEAESKKSRK